MIKQLFPGDHHNFKHDGYYEIEPLSSGPVLIINDEGEKILVDPGAFSHKDKLLDALKAEGLSPADIDAVLNTHHHLDHTSNNFLFHDTTPIYTRSAILWPNGKATIYRDDKLHAEVMPEGIEILQTPGHTDDAISFVYKEDKVTYVCAGDAVREDLIRSQNGYSAHDEDLFAKSMKEVFEIADVIFPGHGKVIEGELFQELKEIVCA